MNKNRLALTYNIDATYSKKTVENTLYNLLQEKELSNIYNIKLLSNEDGYSLNLTNDDIEDLSKDKLFDLINTLTSYILGTFERTIISYVLLGIYDGIPLLESGKRDIKQGEK